MASRIRSKEMPSSQTVISQHSVAVNKHTIQSVSKSMAEQTLCNVYSPNALPKSKNNYNLGRLQILPQPRQCAGTLEASTQCTQEKTTSNKNASSDCCVQAHVEASTPALKTQASIRRHNPRILLHGLNSCRIYIF